MGAQTLQWADAELAQCGCQAELRTGDGTVDARPWPLGTPNPVHTQGVLLPALRPSAWVEGQAGVSAQEQPSASERQGASQEEPLGSSPRGELPGGRAPGVCIGGLLRKSSLVTSWAHLPEAACSLILVSGGTT